MKAFVYILYSASLGKFYVGATEDLEGRLRRHLSNHDGFTAKAKDWILVYHEEFSDINNAKRRERQIKAWKSSLRIRELIDRNGMIQ